MSVASFVGVVLTVAVVVGIVCYEYGVTVGTCDERERVKKGL